jgi:23S rRNA (cytidine1920-2'-O)/16S rRNA (cytidine1409-2'-O)-methyltransferase
MPKQRLDQAVVDRGLAESRSRAQALVLAGRVTVNGVVESKAGTPVADEAAIEVSSPEHPWVGRGGMKLAAALDRFGWSPEGSCCLDLGASTGGFTDVLLQRGAARVWAVDVGRGQIHAKLRGDPRVVLLEKVNARYLDRSLVPDPIDFLSADLSFISLTLVLPAAAPLLAPGSRAVLLVKPQFEAERGEVGHGGIVRDEAVRQRAVLRVRSAALALGWEAAGEMESPIRGQDGNVEFLLGFRCRPGE